MSIQQNINQITSLAGLLISQSPMAKEVAAARVEGKSLQTKGVAAQKGLEDIYKNYQQLKSGERGAYSETEVSDIEKRIPALNEDIYNAVIAAEDPRLSKYIDKSAFGSRAERSKMLNELKGLGEQNTRAKFSKTMEAKDLAADAFDAEIESKKASKNFIDSMKGE